MHTWHNPPLPSQYETYDADESQRYDITGCVHSDCADNLAQVAPNVETIANEDKYPTQSSAGTLEPSEAGIDSVPSQQVLGSAVTQTETNRNVSKLGPDELKVLLPEHACTCATCLQGSRRWWDVKPTEDQVLALTGRILSCRVTGCQWTTGSHTVRLRDNYSDLLFHEGRLGRKDHYGKRGEWRCREIGCKFVTKRWEDFLRHSTSKHCIKPRDLKCPVVECKYHHIDFSRKDKLKSHVDKVHKGTPRPGKSNQSIKPKAKDHA